MNTKPPRAIKFRAWDKKEKVMIDADSWYFSEEFEPFIDSVERCFRQFDLMQFTGLKDKNGTEIYEGDVVKWGSSQEGLWIDQVNKIEVVSDKFYALTGNVGLCEVIGNIHQHKHLLENKNG